MLSRIQGNSQRMVNVTSTVDTSQKLSILKMMLSSNPYLVAKITKITWFSFCRTRACSTSYGDEI